MTSNDKSFDYFIKSNSNLRIPPLRMNIHALIQAFANDHLAAKDLAKVLHHYPVISARLLGLANSAWVSPVTPITHIETACVYLGYTTIKSVSLALAIVSSFDTGRCPSFDPIRFWATSMLVSDGSTLLANKLANPNQQAEEMILTVQTAGVLHNLGLLWLADNMAAETEKALKLTLVNPSVMLNQAIDTCIGMDYCHVGALIFKQWGLPNELVSVVANHRNHKNPQTSSIPTKLVGSAATMVSAIFHEMDTIAEDESLSNLGIDFNQQTTVFNKLVDKLDSTKELARTLFVLKG